jgi:hypothetical protein
MLSQTERKRTEILDAMRQIERLRQGTISEQYYGSGESRQGPYYVLQGYAEGKHWSRRIPRGQVEQVRADLEAGADFQALCRKFAEVTEEATIMADQPDSKKNGRKRGRNATARPKHS